MDISLITNEQNMLIQVAEQWLSWLSVRQEIEGFLVPDPSLAESLCCVLDQDTLSAA